MSNLKMQEKVFIPRDHQKPQLDFGDDVEPMQKRIGIRIHRSIVDRVLDFCAYDDLSPDGKDHYLASFPFIENDYHYDILLGFGNKCECLKPPHVRTEMKRRIHSMATMYS